MQILDCKSDVLGGEGLFYSIRKVHTKSGIVEAKFITCLAGSEGNGVISRKGNCVYLVFDGPAIVWYL